MTLTRPFLFLALLLNLDKRDVLKLYRECLREARKKPQSSRPHFETVARREFEKNLSLDKKDFSAIEVVLRLGQRKLKVYSSPGVIDIH